MLKVEIKCDFFVKKCKLFKKKKYLCRLNWRINEEGPDPEIYTQNTTLKNQQKI